MLFIGGFYDSHLPGTIAAWDALHDACSCSLVIGPWVHFPWQRWVGDLDFGPNADSDIDGRQVAFFDRYLKGDAASAASIMPVRLFDMGLNRWRELPGLPPPNRALWTAGSGRAACDPPGRDTHRPSLPTMPIDYFVHDPWRPVPSRGGCFGAPPGPFGPCWR